jgi:hypothetical protein
MMRRPRAARARLTASLATLAALPTAALPAAALALALAAFLAAAPARAGTEEFSTFDVALQEEDDESVLDHVLTRPPRAWRDEWEHAPQALRTSQGCLTSGQWFIDTYMKLRAPLGRSARLGVDLRQSESDVASYDYLDFSFRFPTRFGTPGAMFRPLYDKSRQDFGLTWEAGADTTAFDAQLAFTIEDMFNNLWAWRQSRVGQQSEPYERHPYEPAMRLRGRGDTWRAEIFGQYLTPSRKLVTGYSIFEPPRRATLWGTIGHAALEARALGLSWELRGENKQARSTDQPVDLSSGSRDNFRRDWSAEAAIQRESGRLTTEARGIYQLRTESWGPPLGPGRFSATDRLLMLDATWRQSRSLAWRVGVMHDSVRVEHSGYQPYSTWGTRKESRAFIGLLARFGRVSVQAIEGIELDHERYQVWFIHDKGFLHLQTTF